MKKTKENDILADHMMGYTWDDIKRYRNVGKSTISDVINKQRESFRYLNLPVIVGLLVSTKLMASLLISEEFDISSATAIRLDRAQERLIDLLGNADEEEIEYERKRICSDETLRNQNIRFWEKIRAREDFIGINVRSSS
jgi:hypothetical protein